MLSPDIDMRPSQMIWDELGEFQSPYFPEKDKQRIGFFLSQHLSGKNLDVGGGWYLAYPDSIVVDFSETCLQYNPAKEKYLFDLDRLGNGTRLPFCDHSFDHATLVSVWQYLRHPEALVQELQRVLVPGGEVYIINRQGAGLQRYIVNYTHSPKIEEYFHARGYDTLLENIPDQNNQIGEYQSVCATMPTEDLFGNKVSVVRQKNARRRLNNVISKNPNLFTERFIKYEVKNMARRLATLSHYLITEYSQDYLRRLDMFTNEFHLRTGNTPIIFAEDTIEAAISTLTPEQQPDFVNLYIPGQRPNERQLADDLERKYNLQFIHFLNYFGAEYGDNFYHGNLVNYFKKFCIQPSDSRTRAGGNEFETGQLMKFLAAPALNWFSRDMQVVLRDRLGSQISDLETQINQRRLAAYYLYTSEVSQRRKIDNIIDSKTRIEDEGIPTVGKGFIDYLALVPQLEPFLKPNKFYIPS